MTTRTRGCLLGAAAALFVVWTGLQFWLTHRALVTENAQGRAAAARFLAAHPGATVHGVTEPASYWVRAGNESAVAMLLVVIVAAALAAGSRRWWTLLVAALPAAVAVGRFHDGMSIGQGWNQPTTTVQTWLAAGVEVDTATVLAIGVLLVLALPVRRSPLSATSMLFRAAPPATILIGWWLVRHPIVDPADRLWLAQAVVWVVLVALVAGAALPLLVRLGVITIVMPLLSFTILDEWIGSYGQGFDAARYLHHLAVAVGVATYVLVVPGVARLVQREAAVPAPAT